ncbi:MAG TPA: nucleotidyltransferase domain-containing protein [Vicinamibacterales bacterium]
MAARDLASVTRAVRRCLAKQRDVSAGYLFGSVAGGRARPDSDIDVGVLLDPCARRGDTLSRRLTLMAELGAALGRSDVDVVILDDAPPLLAHRVLSKGRLVFERSRAARVRFQVRTAGRYLDLVPALEMHIRSMKKHLREGQRVG